MTGRRACARTCTNPERSARRMMPSQIANVPTSGRAMDMTADFRAVECPLGDGGEMAVVLAEDDRE